MQRAEKNKRNTRSSKAPLYAVLVFTAQKPSPRTGTPVSKESSQRHKQLVSMLVHR